jgi:DNA-directed RNA polymerase subunit L
MTDIKVELYKYEPFDKNGYTRGHLQLLCYGKDCNNQFIMALIRIAMKRIPTYAIPKELIKIEKIKKETGYTDPVAHTYDMIRDHIKNTPIVKIDPNVSYFLPKYWKNVDFLDKEREKHPNEKKVNMYIDCKNDTDEIIHVTTNNVKTYIDDEEVKNLYNEKYLFWITSLKPKEAFKCSITPVLSVGLRNSSNKSSQWDSAPNGYFDQETEKDKTILHLEGNLCYDETVLMSRALEYFITFLSIIKKEIERQYALLEYDDDEFNIVFADEDHTLGEVLAYELQIHKDIKYASCSRPDHLIRSIKITVISNNKKTLDKTIFECIDNLVIKIDKFREQFEAIKFGKKEKIDEPEPVFINKSSKKEKIDEPKPDKSINKSSKTKKEPIKKRSKSKKT